MAGGKGSARDAVCRVVCAGDIVYVKCALGSVQGEKKTFEGVV